MLEIHFSLAPFENLIRGRKIASQQELINSDFTSRKKLAAFHYAGLGAEYSACVAHNPRRSILSSLGVI
jgi:hypothetical protein